MPNKTLAFAFAAIASLAQLTGCAPSQSGTAPQEQFAWAVAHRASAPDGNVIALVETGKHKTGDASPLHRVSIKTVGGSGGRESDRVVWESQVSRSPTIVWSANTLLITQDPYLVLEYEPEVTVGGRAYTVDVSITRNGP